LKISDLRNLAKSSLKSFRNDEDVEDSLNETDLTLTEDNLIASGEQINTYNKIEKVTKKTLKNINTV